jgi:hypothetical protein
MMRSTIRAAATDVIHGHRRTQVMNDGGLRAAAGSRESAAALVDASVFTSATMSCTQYDFIPGMVRA